MEDTYIRKGQVDFQDGDDSGEHKTHGEEANSRLAGLFEHSKWDMNDTHRKKELPPLKDTVSILRKKNSKKQKELAEKWHEKTTPAKVKKELGFDSSDSRTNLVEIEESPRRNNNKLQQRESVGDNYSFVNPGFDNNLKYKNDNIYEKESNNNKIDLESNSENIARTNSLTHKENLFKVVNRDTTLDLEDDINNNDDDGEESKTDYRKLALELATNSSKSKKNIERYSLPDFVLTYNIHDSDTLHKKERETFEAKMRDEDIKIAYDIIGENMYVQLYPTFERLCQEAETVALEMPLEGFLVQPAFDDNLVTSLNKSLKTDDEVDMISAPFCLATKKLFHGIEDENTFFRSSHRSMLTRNILENLIISLGKEDEESINIRKRKGLTSLLVSGSYKDGFVLNDRSALDNVYPLKYTVEDALKFLPPDTRRELKNTWLKCLKFQPLWKIRNYYGEKIGLYFAWLGVLITSLWVPTILGIIVFVYGFIVAYNTKEKVSVEAVTGWVTKAFDNNATPYFAVIICLWGTVFCEYWKRTNALLAYKWDVDLFEEQETNRPQFIGTTVKKNPVSGEYEPHYPKWRKVLKSMGSMSIILFMVCLVVTSVVSVVVYKVVSRVDWFKTITNGAFASSMTSSVLNSISILLLGRLYKTLAYKLTEWENHQTKTKYEDALILKLFGFQFVNSYASLFYIAFFRQRTSEGVFNLGTEYSDSCGDNNDCMSLLSLQVAVLMIAKPMPKFFSDIILPFVMKYARKLCCCFKRQSTNVVSSLELQQKDTSDDAEYEAYLRHEHKKPPLDDFTLSEYTEKVLQYGYLMMFAAAFPLAPLIALITNLIDMRVDARRMLWFNRRPFAERAEDIGMWFAILNFLNYVGMLTNALILGLTSQYGNQYKMKTFNVNLPSNVTAFNTTTNQTVNSFPVTIESNNNLWIILIFENVVLAVKFVIAYAIPDIPESVSEAKSQEKIQLGKLLMRSGLTLGPGKTIKPETKQKTKEKQRNKKNRSSLKRVDENSGPSKRKSVGFDVESEN